MPAIPDSKPTTTPAPPHKTTRVLFVLSLLVFLFYLASFVLFSNIYKHAVVGAIYELLSLPMLLLLVVVPVLSVIQLLTRKGGGWAYALAALVLIACSVALLLQNT
jgi:TRAP-type C4-dicarboxylate transport system permease small subunit